jgi:hypothetical protein
LELSLRKYLLTSYHGLINYFDIKAKCRPLKILTCEGTSWQLYIRVYRLVILVFLTQLCEPSNLLSGSLSLPNDFI